MKFSDLIKSLADGGIDSPDTEAFIIAEKFAGITKSALIINKDIEIDNSELEDVLSRRINGEPLQYILGEWYFMGEKYYVGPGCLIPRGDTEILCEEVIKYLPDNGRLLDLCTGSGCVAVSALVRCTSAVGVGLEKYPETADYARKNAFFNNVDDRFIVIEGDVFHYIPDGQYDVISANPPYIPADDMKMLQRELNMEPHNALTDGKDGLSFYKHIIPAYLPFLKKDGRMIMEMGIAQAPFICEIAEKQGCTCEIKKDYGGIERVIIIKSSR